MYKKSISFLAIFVVMFLFSACDVSKKVRENQKEISFLKENSRLLTEAVNNYERSVKKLTKETESLKKQVAILKKKIR